MKELGSCDKCKKTFNYRLIHNGFNESTYAYCDKCGMTAFLDEYFNKIPKDCVWFSQKNNRYEKIDQELERFLKKCLCGGSFKRNSKPRCPHCISTLTASKATSYIEGNSIGAKKGWRWQKSWNGIYAIVIDGKSIVNNWKELEGWR